MIGNRKRLAGTLRLNSTGKSEGIFEITRLINVQASTKRHEPTRVRYDASVMKAVLERIHEFNSDTPTGLLDLIQIPLLRFCIEVINRRSQDDGQFILGRLVTQ